MPSSSQAGVLARSRDHDSQCLGLDCQFRRQHPIFTGESPSAGAAGSGYRRCKSAIARSTDMVFLFTSDMIFAVHAASAKPMRMITARRPPRGLAGTPPKEPLRTQEP